MLAAGRPYRPNGPADVDLAAGRMRTCDSKTDVLLPQGLTPHSMRRTFISLLLAIGEDVPYVMGQVGHVDPKVTLSSYAQVMFRGEGRGSISRRSSTAPIGHH